MKQEIIIVPQMLATVLILSCRVSSQWNKIITVGAAVTPVRAKPTNMIRMHVSTKNARCQHISSDSDRPSIFIIPF